MALSENLRTLTFVAQSTIQCLLGVMVPCQGILGMEQYNCSCASLCVVPAFPPEMGLAEALLRDGQCII